MDNELKAEKLAMKYLLRGCSKSLFLSAPLIEISFIGPELYEILHQIKVNKLNLAEKNIKKLKCKFPYTKVVLFLNRIFSSLAEEELKDMHPTSIVMTDFYLEDGFRQLMKDSTLVVDHDLFKKFIELAEKVDNIPGAAYEAVLTFLNFFKALGQGEPFILRKTRDDIEYVFLIQSYLDGSKDLPEKTKDNFDYALLSEFLKKDDIRVLKSLESYLETKALGAAGAVAQSIERENLSSIKNKKKKDIKRIENLELKSIQNNNDEDEGFVESSQTDINGGEELLAPQESQQATITSEMPSWQDLLEEDPAQQSTVPIATEQSASPAAETTTPAISTTLYTGASSTESMPESDIQEDLGVDSSLPPISLSSSEEFTYRDALDLLYELKNPENTAEIIKMFEEDSDLFYKVFVAATKLDNIWMTDGDAKFMFEKQVAGKSIADSLLILKQKLQNVSSKADDAIGTAVNNGILSSVNAPIIAEKLSYYLLPESGKVKEEEFLDSNFYSLLPDAVPLIEDYLTFYNSGIDKNYYEQAKNSMSLIEYYKLLATHLNAVISGDENGFFTQLSTTQKPVEEPKEKITFASAVELLNNLNKANPEIIKKLQTDKNYLRHVITEIVNLSYSHNMSKEQMDKYIEDFMEKSQNWSAEELEVVLKNRLTTAINYPNWILGKIKVNNSELTLEEGIYVGKKLDYLLNSGESEEDLAQDEFFMLIEDNIQMLMEFLANNTGIDYSYYNQVLYGAPTIFPFLKIAAKHLVGLSNDGVDITGSEEGNLPEDLLQKENESTQQTQSNQTDNPFISPNYQSFGTIISMLEKFDPLAVQAVSDPATLQKLFSYVTHLLYPRDTEDERNYYVDRAIKSLKGKPAEDYVDEIITYLKEGLEAPARLLRALEFSDDFLDDKNQHLILDKVLQLIELYNNNQYPSSDQDSFLRALENTTIRRKLNTYITGIGGFKPDTLPELYNSNEFTYLIAIRNAIQKRMKQMALGTAKKQTIVDIQPGEIPEELGVPVGSGLNIIARPYTSPSTANIVSGVSGGGTFVGADGIIRFVKPAQKDPNSSDPTAVPEAAFGEHVASIVLRGFDKGMMPETVLQQRSNGVYVGSEYNADVSPIGAIQKSYDEKILALRDKIKLAESNGHNAMADVYRQDLQNLEEEAAQLYDEAVSSGMYFDILIANWDAVGAKKGNLLVTKGNPPRIIRIDAGGAFFTRGTGGPKSPKSLQFSAADGTVESSIQGFLGNPEYMAIMGRSNFIERDETGQYTLTPQLYMQMLAQSVQLEQKVRGLSSNDQPLTVKDWEDYIKLDASELMSDEDIRRYATFMHDRHREFQIYLSTKVSESIEKSAAGSIQRIEEGNPIIVQDSPSIVASISQTNLDKQLDPIKERLEILSQLRPDLIGVEGYSKKAVNGLITSWVQGFINSAPPEYREAIELAARHVLLGQLEQSDLERLKKVRNASDKAYKMYKNFVLAYQERQILGADFRKARGIQSEVDQWTLDRGVIAKLPETRVWIEDILTAWESDEIEYVGLLDYVHSASSWSLRGSNTPRKFANGHPTNIVFRATVDDRLIFSDYLINREFYGYEHEFIVMNPRLPEYQLQIRKSDIELTIDGVLYVLTDDPEQNKEIIRQAREAYANAKY